MSKRTHVALSYAKLANDVAATYNFWPDQLRGVLDDVEVAQVLRRYAASGEAGPERCRMALADLRGLPLMRYPHDFLLPRAWELRNNLTAYDAVYVALAEALDAPLLTRDQQPDLALPVLREHELALTGGVERGEFEALFEASAGTRGIAAILTTLDDDAKKLFNPHGRAQNATINEARRQLDEQRTAWRQAQTKPAEWQALNRAHEQAKAALAAAARPCTGGTAGAGRGARSCRARASGPGWRSCNAKRSRPRRVRPRNRRGDLWRRLNILRALARFAEGGQVMIFTHHRHLIDVARAALSDKALAVHSL